MASESGHGDLVECFVELMVSVSVESVTVLGLARGGWDWGDTSEPGVGGLVAAASWVCPCNREGCGGDGADPDLGDELGSGLVNESGQGLVVGGDLTVEVGDPAGHGLCRGPGALLVEGPVVAVAEPIAAF